MPNSGGVSIGEICVINYPCYVNRDQVEMLVVGCDGSKSSDKELGISSACKYDFLPSKFRSNPMIPCVLLEVSYLSQTRMTNGHTKGSTINIKKFEGRMTPLHQFRRQRNVLFFGLHQMEFSEVEAAREGQQPRSDEIRPFRKRDIQRPGEHWEVPWLDGGLLFVRVFVAGDSSTETDVTERSSRRENKMMRSTVRGGGKGRGKLGGVTWWRVKIHGIRRDST